MIELLKITLSGLAVIIIGAFISPLFPSEIAFALGFLVQCLSIKLFRTSFPKFEDTKIYAHLENVRVHVEEIDKERVRYKLMLGSIIGIIHNKHFSNEEKIEKIKDIAIGVLDDGEKKENENDNMEGS